MDALAAHGLEREPYDGYSVEQACSLLASLDDREVTKDDALHTGVLNVVRGIKGFRAVLRDTATRPFTDDIEDIRDVCLSYLQENTVLVRNYIEFMRRRDADTDRKLRQTFGLGRW